MRKQMKKTAAILMAALLAVSTLAAPAVAATSYTTITAPGSFTSSDSSDNTLSVIAYYNTDQSEMVSDLTIEDSTSGVNGIVVDNADVDFSDITITLDTDADGSDTCDFTGKGTAFAVYGDSDVTLSDAVITAAGVATMPLFIDDGAVLTVQDTTITSNGGTLYSSYVNTADQSVMVSPPWVLGIMGTSRASNLMGTGSTLNFLDSTANAAMWAILSTDSGSDMVMNVYNSTLQLTRGDESSVAIQEDGGQITTYDDPYTTSYGAGYGTYVIGDVTETMVGVTINVGTYAAIFTGGTMSFSTLTAGDYTLSNADSSVTSYTYSGDTRNSVINSDTFGFMAHQGDNTLTLGSGTSLNTGYTGFLIKTGGSLSGFTANVTGTDISVGDNVLIQVLDNEDSLIGTSSGSTFATTYTESSGWLASDSSDDSGDSGDSGSGGTGGPGDGSSGGGESGGPGGGSSGGGPGGSQGNGISTTAATDSTSSDSVIFNFIGESALTGNIYNSSGDQLTGTGVTVNLSDTTYYGAAASTTAIHVTYEGAQYVRDTLNGYAVEADDEGEEVLSYQNTEITISEYYDLGHVANKINSNGSNTVTISLTDDSTWYVTGTSVLSSLSVEDGSQVILVGDATLTVNGTTYSADNLGDNMSHVDSLDDEEEEACDHSYEAVVTAPTCTELGYTTYTCTLCGDSYVADYTEATGHSYSSEITTEATCTEDGEMTYTCTVCGDSYTETIEATGHSYEAVVTEPTCTEQGYTTYTCMVCGDSYVADYTDAPGHIWDDGVVTSEATETEAGEITYTCTVCGETRTEEIAPTGEHTWDEGEVTTEATCTENGVMTYTCTGCGATYTEVIPATGHTYEAVVTEPTCTEQGYTTYTCTVCGDSYTETISATGHNYDDGVVTTEPTCTEDGVMTYTCTVCGDSYTETIPATGHSYEAVVTEATCTEDGYTTYTCTVCGDSYIADETEATGHTAGEAVTENLVEATCTEDGSYDSVVYCSVCGEELSRETVTVSATGHNYENGVCTVCGAQESGSGSGSGGFNSGSIWQNFRDWLNNFFGRWN